MSLNDPTLDPTQKSTGGKRRKRIPRKRQLRVVFDTSVLYTGSASDLVRQEIANVVAQAKYSDLEVVWYLPEIVRLERQHQMRKRALDLQPSLVKIEKLLGHNLAITSDLLLQRVDEAACRGQDNLGLTLLKLDYAMVDWNRMVHDAAHRRPPFEDGDTEKGFRDALVAESFLQLVTQSPKGAHICRVVLVTGDKLLTDAVESRLTTTTNARVIASAEKLTEFINTLISEVDEEFVAQLKERASRIFFIQNDKSTLYHASQVREKIEDKFRSELAALPPGAQRRKNGTWRISPPNFSKKIKQRAYWISRIEIEAEATKVITESSKSIADSIAILNQAFSSLGASLNRTASEYTSNLFAQFPVPTISPGATLSSQPTAFLEPLPYVKEPVANWPSVESAPNSIILPSSKTIITHRGVSTFEVLWSTDVTTSVDVRRPSIDEYVYVTTTWETAT